MVVTITSGGYIEAHGAGMNSSAQRRGGPSGMATPPPPPPPRVRGNTHTVFCSYHRRHGLSAEDVAAPGWAHRQGKAIVNILPIELASPIAALMPVDAPQAEWDDYQVIFAPRRATCAAMRCRISPMSCAMARSHEAARRGSRLIGARMATENDDVMLVTAMGRAIRFQTTDVRVFKGRDSTGVRGIRLGSTDSVVSMSIIRHFETDPPSAPPI